MLLLLDTKRHADGSVDSEPSGPKRDVLGEMMHAQELGRR